MVYRPILTRNVAPIDSAQYARSVREDTAELASYALSERASVSPPTYQRSAQTQLESYFAHGSKTDSTSIRGADRLSTDIIQEESEPASPQGHSPLLSWKAPGTSALTDMFRRPTPPELSLDQGEQSDLDITNRTSQSRTSTKVSTEQGLQGINSDATNLPATERTSLIPRLSASESHDHSIPQAQQDLEGQETVTMRWSWSKMHRLILWPREKGFTLARTLKNPKKWDRAALWRNVIVAPSSCLPAVALGLLLNILDALSYGRLHRIPHSSI